MAGGCPLKGDPRPHVPGGGQARPGSSRGQHVGTDGGMHVPRPGHSCPVAPSPSVTRPRARVEDVGAGGTWCWGCGAPRPWHVCAQAATCSAEKPSVGVFLGTWARGEHRRHLAPERCDRDPGLEGHVAQHVLGDTHGGSLSMTVTRQSQEQMHPCLGFTVPAGGGGFPPRLRGVSLRWCREPQATPKPQAPATQGPRRGHVPHEGRTGPPHRLGTCRSPSLFPSGPAYSPLPHRLRDPSVPAPGPSGRRHTGVPRERREHGRQRDTERRRTLDTVTSRR